MNYCLRCNQLLLSRDTHYGQHLSCFEGIFRCKGRVEFESLTLKNTTGSDPQNQVQNSPHLTSYFGGNYRKYEGKLDKHSYIIKLSKSDYPELAPVEFVCNKIAYDCGLTVPVPFSLVDFGKGEFAFISKNFMQDKTTHTALNHLYHYLPEGNDHYNVEEIMNAIFRETQSAKDVEQFFRVLLIDALIGNHDRHGRNLALVETAGRKKLAPIYDNPSALGLYSGAWLKANHSPRGKIWTANSQEPQMVEYLDEMKRLGVMDIAKKMHNSIRFETIKARVADSHSLSKNMKEALIKLIEQRYGDFKSYVEA